MSNVKIICCQNCDNCTDKNYDLGIGECEYDGLVCLKDSCEAFMWNYNNKNEYKECD